MRASGRSAGENLPRDAQESIEVILFASASGLSIRSLARSTGIGVETLRSLSREDVSSSRRLVSESTHQRLQSWRRSVVDQALTSTAKIAGLVAADILLAGPR